MTERILGLDAVRYLGFAAAALLHAIFAQPGAAAHEAMLALPTRFAVPYFFLVAGMMLGRRAGILPMARRLLIPFAFWAVIYVVVSGAPASTIFQPLYLAHLVVDGGPGFHLWFLTSLCLCSIIALSLRNRPGLLLAIAAALYAIGLAFGVYYNAFHAGPYFWWDTRDGPFFGLLFVAVGYAMPKTRVPAVAAWSLVVLGLALQFVEFNWLNARGAFDTARGNFFFGTLPFGIGVFLVARSLPHSRPVVALARLGRYTLGFYCAHLLVLMALTWRGPPGSTPEALALGAATILITTVAVLLAARIKWLLPVLR